MGYTMHMSQVIYTTTSKEVIPKNNRLIIFMLIIQKGKSKIGFRIQNSHVAVGARIILVGQLQCMRKGLTWGVFLGSVMFFNANSLTCSQAPCQIQDGSKLIKQRNQDGSKLIKQRNCQELRACFQLSALKRVKGHAETPG